MISKSVSSRSFYHTCRYITEKSGAEIILSQGVRDHDYKLMADDFETQKELRPSKSRACFHSILSFYPGEKPSDEVMKEIARKYLAELGIVNTQYVTGKHTDKAHLHLHIVANMVNNDGKAISDSWIGLRGKKIAQRLTEEYKLIPALEKNLSLTNLEALSNSEATKYQIYIAISENLPRCKSIEELESRLCKLGIETQYKYKGQTYEKQGVSFKKDTVCFKGSQVDRKFSFEGLKKTFELQNKNSIKQSLKPDQEGIFSQQKSITQQISKTIIPAVNERQTTLDAGKGLEKTIEILLKPEHTNSQTPFTFSQQTQRRKKKKSKSIGG